MKEIELYFDKSQIESLTQMVELMDKMKLSDEMIKSRLKYMDSFIRNGIYLIAQEKNISFASKIYKINNEIKEEILEDFKKSVMCGYGDEFLSKMSSKDKKELEHDLGLIRVGMPFEERLTNEEEKMLDMIEKSIYEDVKSKNKVKK